MVYGNPGTFLYPGNLAEPYARILFADSCNLAQTVRHLRFGDQQQYAIANDDGSKTIGQGDRISQPSPHVQAACPDWRNFVLRSIETDRCPYTTFSGCLKQKSISASDVYETVFWVKCELFENPLIHKRRRSPERTSPGK